MKVSNFYPQAMGELISESGWRVTDEVIDLSQCETTVTEDEIINKAQELFNKWQSLSYQRDRASAYPSWQDQMDLLYHGGVDALKAELKKTKDKYPKPT